MEVRTTTRFPGRELAGAMKNLLAHTQSGAALPVGQVQVRRHCGLSGETDAARDASAARSALWLASQHRTEGGASFVLTTPAPSDSSLASNGVVLYVLIRRALAAGSLGILEGRSGCRRRGGTGRLCVARGSGFVGTSDAISIDYPIHRGVWSFGRKAPRHFQPQVVCEDKRPWVLAGSLWSPTCSRGSILLGVDDRAGSLASLIQEIWCDVLVAMIGALLLEVGAGMPWSCRLERAWAEGQEERNERFTFAVFQWTHGTPAPVYRRLWSTAGFVVAWRRSG